MTSPSPFERATNKALGELLVERGFLTQEQCEKALAYARERGLRIGEALLELGFVSHDLLSAALGEQFGTRPMVLDPSMLDFELLERFPVELLAEHKLLPLTDLGDELIVAVGDPHDQEGLEKLSALVPDRRLVLQLANAVEIAKCLAHPRIAQRVGASGEGREASTFQSAVRRGGENVEDHIEQLLDAAQAPVCARLGLAEISWWKEGEDATVTRLEVEEDLGRTAGLQEFLTKKVEWVNDGAVRGGYFAQREDGSVVAVSLAWGVGEMVVRFRRWVPYETASPTSLLRPPLGSSLVILVYNEVAVLADCFAALSSGATVPPVLVTEHLRWRYVGALQLPVAVPQIVTVARLSGVRVVAFDVPVPPGLVALLLMGHSHLECVLVALEEDKWRRDGELVYGELLRAHRGVVLRATCDGLAPMVSNVPTDQSTAR